MTGHTHPPDPLGDPLAVRITGREIYDAVVRLTGRLDVLIEQQTETRADVADHETRIRMIERRMWPLPTVGLLVSLATLGIVLLPKITN